MKTEKVLKYKKGFSNILIYWSLKTRGKRSLKASLENYC